MPVRLETIVFLSQDRKHFSITKLFPVPNSLFVVWPGGRENEAIRMRVVLLLGRLIDSEEKQSKTIK